MPRKKLKVIEIQGTTQGLPEAAPKANVWPWKAREVFAVVLLLLAAYATTSLLTYRASDLPSVFWDPGHSGPAANSGGTLGASLATFLYRYLGVTAYGLIFFLAFWGAMILLRQQIRDGLFKFAGVVLFLVAAATFLSLVTPDGFNRTELYRDTLVPSLGGAYGDRCRDLLVLYVGGFGAFLSVVLVLSVSMVLATDWMIYFGLLRAWRMTQVAALACLVAGRRFHTAWSALPPLLATAGHGIKVRVPAPDNADAEVPSGNRKPRGRSGWQPAPAPLGSDESARTAAPTTNPAEAELPSYSEDEDDLIPTANVPGARSAPSDSVAAAPPAPVEPEEPTAIEPEPIAPAPVQAAPAAAADPEPPSVPEPESTPTPVTFAPSVASVATDPAPDSPETAPGELSMDPVENDGSDNLAADLEGRGLEDLEADAPPVPVADLPPSNPTINLGVPPPTPADAPLPPPPPRKSPASFPLPPLQLLEEPTHTDMPTLERDVEQRIKGIEMALQCFGIQVRVVHVDRGPSITMFELELAPGVRLNKIIGMSDDLAVALKVPHIRVVAPIPGKSSVGIEVPNQIKDQVRTKEFMTTPDQPWKNYFTPLFLGKDVTGMHVVKNLEEMPHLLVAGTTGSGKSVCLNCIILSLLLTRTPDELKLILIDPKMVEMTAFRDMPHLHSPVVTDMKKAPTVLDWAVRHMDERYDLMARAGVKKIATYNSLGEKKLRERLGVDDDTAIPITMPRIIIVIDELADLMMVAAKEVETSIIRLAQKSRAVGIHLVLATQRPSVDVITGLIKSNMPARIAFKVASGIDSRTILDQNGAERLLGKGDMLVSVPGSMEMVRAQCTYVSDQEITDVVEYLKSQGAPVYDNELVEVTQGEQIASGEHDELYAEAVRVVVESQRGSVSLLQRKMGIGYSRAARLVDMMAVDGIVGSYKGSKAREVIMSMDQYRARFVTASERAQM